jgi:hypothetical protein
MIGHVLAESYANKRRQFKSYLMNFRQISVKNLCPNSLHFSPQFLLCSHFQFSTHFFLFSFLLSNALDQIKQL